MGDGNDEDAHKVEAASINEIIKEVSEIADKFPFNDKEKHFRKEIISLVSKVNTDTLGLQLPSKMPSNIPFKVLAGNVYKKSTKFESSVFVFPKSGNKLPFHDHPNMEGFIKALKGKLLITSFSLLNSEEEKRLRKEEFKEGNEKVRPAKFEGTLLLDATTTTASSPSEVVNLNALTGNIHSIESIDGLGAFFDILIPGYHQAHGNVPCTFFEMDEKNLTSGKIYWLKVVPANLIPNLVSMGKLEMPSIVQLD
uniref:2-aminoethanethiol dioxygenase n=1 Tax=Panagrolaimus superbus TaxID=310955 RepID=A0A914Y3U6_9BILA